MSGRETIELTFFDYGMNVVRAMDTNGVSGANEIMWDGRDHRGIGVSNGVYL